MIEALERPTSTYDAIKLPVQGFRNLYTGIAKVIAAHNSTAILYDLINTSPIGQADSAVTSGFYSQFPFWALPVAPQTPVLARSQKLSLKRAQNLALEALTSAEERRQREREAEAKYWSDLD